VTGSLTDDRIPLKTVLDLVGKLDDSPGENTPRERFRVYLKNNVNNVAQLRDFIEECLRETGDQYSKALQDLINHLGKLMGFEVNYGRYQGVISQTGYDGHWISQTKKHIVIEVKTTEVYSIKTATILSYIDALVSEKKIPERDVALGLYVVGKPDPEINQFESLIRAEKLIQQLRIISVNSLISLAELMNEYDVNHDDILAIIFPSGPKIDSIVDLMSRLVAQRQLVPPTAPSDDTETKETEPDEITATTETAYWLTPIKSNDTGTAEDSVRGLVGDEKLYAFGDRTPGRKTIKPGDLICFYATTNGVVAHAKVASYPERKPSSKIKHAEDYPWTFKLANPKLYIDNPVVIDSNLRSRLDAFKGRDMNKPWAWFVQFTHQVSVHDFNLLTQK